MTIISLYTSRITLYALGFESYGLYQIVCGVLIAFSFFSIALNSATRRYLNVALGGDNEENLKKIFSSGLTLHLILSIAILIMGDTLGLWFLIHVIDIPPARFMDAVVVYQLSILSMMASVMSIPYSAAIIAHERMSVYAFISILEGALKLIVAFTVLSIRDNALIIYAILLFLSVLIIRIVYYIYCKSNFKECTVKVKNISKNLITEMASFSGWTLLGSVRYVGHTQGVAILINLFYGVIVNAALGIANQVTAIVTSFVSNFLTSISPQVMKIYATGDNESLRRLVIRGSKMSVYLSAIIIIPLVLEIDYVLKIWLTDVPIYTSGFVSLYLLSVLLHPYAEILQNVNSATGRIKKYQTSLAIIGMLHVPLCWLFFSIGSSPLIAVYLYIIIVAIIQIVRIIMACNVMKMPVGEFIAEILIKGYGVILLSSIIPYLLHLLCVDHFLKTLLVILANLICVIFVSLFWGIESEERFKVIRYAKELLHIKK